MTRFKEDKRYHDKKRFGSNWFKVLKRDKWRCQLCGVKEKRQKDGIQKILVIHHKDGNGRNVKNPNNKLKNLITLCRKCHRVLHGGKVELSENKNQKAMEISKSDLAQIIFLILALGWFLGRFTEAVALGNIPL